MLILPVYLCALLAVLSQWGICLHEIGLELHGSKAIGWESSHDECRY